MSKGLKVLYIEDNPDDVLLLEHVLKRMNRLNLFEIVTDPGIALETLTTDPAGFKLVITDSRLPGMNGLDVVQALKANPDTNHLPCIVLTAMLSDDEIALAYKAGAAAVFLKPNEISDFSDLVRQIISYWETAIPPLSATPARTSAVH